MTTYSSIGLVSREPEIDQRKWEQNCFCQSRQSEEKRFVGKEKRKKISITVKMDIHFICSWTTTTTTTTTTATTTMVTSTATTPMSFQGFPTSCFALNGFFDWPSAVGATLHLCKGRVFPPTEASEPH